MCTSQFSLTDLPLDKTQQFCLALRDVLWADKEEFPGWSFKPILEILRQEKINLVHIQDLVKKVGESNDDKGRVTLAIGKLIHAGLCQDVCEPMAQRTVKMRADEVIKLIARNLKSPDFQLLDTKLWDAKDNTSQFNPIVTRPAVPAPRVQIQLAWYQRLWQWIVSVLSAIAGYLPSLSRAPSQP